MRINYNEMSSMANRNYFQHGEKASKCIMRLSTGKRVNSAADDPAGIVKINYLKAAIREMGVYIKNNEEKIDQLKIEEDEQMGEIDILQRLKELAIQIASDTNTDRDREVMMEEFSSLLEEIGKKINENTGMDIVVDESGEMMFAKSGKIFKDGEWISVDQLNNGQKGDNYQSLIDYADALLKNGLKNLGNIGATINDITYKLNNLYRDRDIAIERLSLVEDADMAEEMYELVKEKMLSEVSVAVAAAANAEPKRVLYLLEGMDI